MSCRRGQGSSSLGYVFSTCAANVQRVCTSPERTRQQSTVIAMSNDSQTWDLVQSVCCIGLVRDRVFPPTPHQANSLLITESHNRRYSLSFPLVASFTASANDLESLVR